MVIHKISGSNAANCGSTPARPSCRMHRAGDRRRFAALAIGLAGRLARHRTDPSTDADIEPKTVAWWNALRDVDARIGELVLGDRRLPSSRWRWPRLDSGLRVEPMARILAGRVTVPDQPTQRSRSTRRCSACIGIALGERQRLDRCPDPRRLPPLVLTAVNCGWTIRPWVGCGSSPCRWRAAFVYRKST